MTRDDVRPGANGFNDYANNTYLNPLAGVKVYILGHESEAVYTDATGRFTISNAPVGDLQIAVDGAHGNERTRRTVLSRNGHGHVRAAWHRQHGDGRYGIAGDATRQ